MPAQVLAHYYSSDMVMETQRNTSSAYLLPRPRTFYLPDLRVLYVTRRPGLLFDQIFICQTFRVLSLPGPLSAEPPVLCVPVLHVQGLQVLCFL